MSYELTPSAAKLYDRLVQTTNIQNTRYGCESLQQTLSKLDSMFVKIVQNLIDKTSLKFDLRQNWYGPNPHRISHSSGGYSDYYNRIECSPSDIHTFKHEVGHALDHRAGDLTLTHKIGDTNQTFFEIIVNELKSCYTEALKELLEYSKTKDALKIDNAQIERLIPFFETHSDFYTMDESRKESYDTTDIAMCLDYENKLFSRMEKAGYVEDVLTTFGSISFDKYYPSLFDFSKSPMLTDLLSCRFNFKFLSGSRGHGPNYYGYTPENVAREVFANLCERYDFDAEELQMNEPLFIKYFPKTIESFKILVKYGQTLLFRDDFNTIKHPRAKESFIDEMEEEIDCIKVGLGEMPQKEVDYKAGMEESIQLGKHLKLSNLSNIEKDILYDCVNYILWHRKDDFRYMFGEKFKYQPYQDLYKNKFLTRNYYFMYELDMRLNNKLSDMVHEEMQTHKKYNTLSKETIDHIVDALKFH